MASKSNALPQQSAIPVLVIGAGISGIALGARLRSKLNVPAKDIRIVERQSGIGGTWHINRYPGVACDIPALFYSYSFSPNPNWTSFHPGADEIATYLREVAEKHGITGSVTCNIDVEGCRWDEEEKLWHVRLRYLKPGMGDLSSKDRRKVIRREGIERVVAREETVKAKIVCSCVGGLVEPKGWPEDIKGIERYRGSMFHSARWDYSVDLKDKDIVVIGTGCSAAQFVPKLTKDYGAKSVTQLMRSPPWVRPKIEEPGGTENWGRWAPFLFTYVPGLLKLSRFAIFAAAELDWPMFGDGEKAARARAKYEAGLLRHMKEKVPEKYHEMLTPDYGVGCKRRIFNGSWLESLNDPQVELTTQPLKSVKERSVILGGQPAYPVSKEVAPETAPEDREIPADVIVLANGFDTTKWLHPLQVIGRNGVDLVAEMDARGGPQAYNGTAMDGFPNFLMIFGPNTATGHSSVIMAIENMVVYALQFIKLILRNEATLIEVKHEAEVQYAADCQETLRGTVYNSGCNSWYVNNGWNSTVYPWSQVHFIYRSYFPRWSDWNIEYTSKGIWLRRSRTIFKAILVATALILASQLREVSLPNIMVWLRETRESLRGIGAHVLQALR